MRRVLVAGSTGYLGRYLVSECKRQGYSVHALARDRQKLDDLKVNIDNLIEADVTKPESLTGTCEGIDIVISSVGITRQKDGLSYMDVDYKANLNLLQEAHKSKIKKFIYVSVLNAHMMTDLKIIQAKERFAKELVASGIDFTIIRPNGFFSDMTELLNMAKRGSVYLFGDGKYESNPIHGEDLAKFIVQNFDTNKGEIDIGGPDVFTQNQMAQLAFDAVRKTKKMIYIPLWIKNTALKLVRWFSGPKTYGPIEFFMTVMTMDMIAPRFGNHHLSDYYKEIIEP